MANIESFNEMQRKRQEHLKEMQKEFAEKNKIVGNDFKCCLGTGKIIHVWKTEICQSCQV